MKLSVVTIVSLGMLFWFGLRFCSPSKLSAVRTIKPSAGKTIRYTERNLPQGIAHILWIPANSQFLVTPALSSKVNTLEEFANKYPSVAIFNAGFFDPVNQKSTSYIVIGGQLVADPKDNKRLIDNPKLKSYLNLILNRSEFRRYLCGQTMRYAIALHNQLPPADCQSVDAIGAGPQLLPKMTLMQEAFVDNTLGRDALGSQQPNARTAVGITDDGSVILVMVAQKPSQPNNSGISLPQLADLMKSLGVKEAMNLDGGSSSSFYFQGKTFYGKVNEQGNPVKRPVKSVLLVEQK